MLVLATSDEHIHTKYGSPGVSNFWGTLGSHTHTHTHTHFSKPFTVRGGSIKLISTVFMRFKKQVSNNKWSTRAYEFCKVWNLCIKLLSNKTFSLLPYMDMLLIIWLWDVIFISTTWQVIVQQCKIHSIWSSFMLLCSAHKLLVSTTWCILTCYCQLQKMVLCRQTG